MLAPDRRSPRDAERPGVRSHAERRNERERSHSAFDNTRIVLHIINSGILYTSGVPAMPTADDRRDAWADAVFDAVAVLRAAMTDPAAPRALAAAAEVLRLEIARLRHGRPLAGTDESVGDAEVELPPFAF